MPERSLKELSDLATPGEMRQPDWGSDLRAGRTLIGMMSPVPEGNGKANGAYLCRLWNDHRAGRLHDDTALSQAEARGRAAGLGEAAKAADEVLAGFNEENPLGCICAFGADEVARAIRALLPPQPPALDALDQTEGGR